MKTLNVFILTLFILSSLNAQEKTSYSNLKNELKALKLQLSSQNNQNNAQAAVLTYLLDSTHNSRWSTIDNNWYLESRTLYTNDKFGSIDTLISLTQRNNIWTNSLRAINIYDSNNYRIKTESQRWNITMNQWVNSTKTENIYNLNGLLLQVVIYTWLQSNSIWEPRTKRIYQYNSNSSLNEHITQKWDANINQFINTDKSKLSYNSNQDIDTFLFLSWDTLSNIWLNRTQFISKYDNKHNEIESENQDWDITTKLWQKISLDKYSYDQNNSKILTIEYEWLNNNWVELYKTKYNNTYDTDLNLIKVINQDWDTTSQTFINYDKIDYFYSKHDIISNTASKENSTIKIYPNPCQDFITIDGLTLSSQVSIFDLQSNPIQVEKDIDRIDLSNLNSGIYFLRIRKENENLTFKIIKI
jgi:hypothetical protein